MICKKCGATIEDNSIECKFCGAKFGTAEEPAPKKNADEIKEATKEAVDASDAPTADAASEADEFEYSGEEIDRMLDENEKNRKLQLERLTSEKQKQLREIEKRRESKKKKQRLNRLLIVLAILAVLGGAGAGIYYLNANKPETPAIEVVTEAPQATEEPEVTEEPGDETGTEAPTELVQPAQDSGNASNGGTGTAASGGAGSGTVSSGSGSGAGSATSRSGNTGGGSGAATSSGGSTGAGVSASGKKSGAASGGTVRTSGAKLSPGTKYTAKGGFDGEKFTAALITGSEVIENNGRKYMRFDFNGASYYANVDAGTTTAYISGKPMTVNAYKTSEVFNGESIYEITALTKYDSSYIIPESGYRLLTENDLKGKTAKELYIGRNEIYARHGRQFKDKELQTYFNSCSWYKIKSSYNTANDASNLNSIENENAKFILKYEQLHK